MTTAETLSAPTNRCPGVTKARIDHTGIVVSAGWATDDRISRSCKDSGSRVALGALLLDGKHILS